MEEVVIGTHGGTTVVLPDPTEKDKDRTIVCSGSAVKIQWESCVCSTLECYITDSCAATFECGVFDYMGKEKLYWILKSIKKNGGRAF